jgi:aspartyl/asparaginyl-tRNA synthetase
MNSRQGVITMKNELTSEAIKYIIARVLDNANDAIEESKENKNDDFYSGKRLAYYEVLDTIKNELVARNQDLKEFGLDINLESDIL